MIQLVTLPKGAKFSRENYSGLPADLQTAVRRMFVEKYRLRPVQFWMEDGTIEGAHDDWAQALYDEAAVFRQQMRLEYHVLFDSSCKKVYRPPRDPEDPDTPAPRALEAAFESVV